MLNQYETDIHNESNNGLNLFPVPIVLIIGEVAEEETSFTNIVDCTSSDISIENKLNKQRLAQFRKEFSVNFLKCLREQNFEYGIDTPADELVRKLFSENESFTKEWMNELFLEYFNDQTVSIGLLRVLSHFDYREVIPQGLTMALAALSHISAEVRECGIRVFENWGNLCSLKVLKNIDCKEKWLNDYLHQVIADIEEEL